MRYRLSILLLLVSLGGCGPGVSRQELGIVVFEVPKVAGTSNPYEIPQLGPPLKHEDEDILNQRLP